MVFKIEGTIPQRADQMEARIESVLAHALTLAASEKDQSYAAQYAVLKRLGQDVTAETAQGLAMAVYAWMPTILRSYNDPTLSDSVIKSIKSATPKTMDSLIASLIDEDTKKPPVNQSWVGTSKFLHFLNPALFPIWDSRVGRVFGLTRHDQINHQRNYTAYVLAIHRVAKTEPGGSLDNPIRDIEVALFRLGGTKSNTT